MDAAASPPASYIWLVMFSGKKSRKNVFMSGNQTGRIWWAAIIVIPAYCLASRCSAPPYHKTADGVVISLKETPHGARKLRLRVIGDHIIRVSATATDSFSRNPSLMIVATPHAKPEWKVQQQAGRLILSTAALRAVVSLPDGRITFTDSSGNVLLREKPGG